MKFNPYKILFMAACVLAASMSLLLLYMTVFMAAIWGVYGLWRVYGDTSHRVLKTNIIILGGFGLNLVTAIKVVPDASALLILMYGIVSFFTGAFLLFLMTNFVLLFLSAFGLGNK